VFAASSHKLLFQDVTLRAGFTEAGCNDHYAFDTVCDTIIDCLGYLVERGSNYCQVDSMRPLACWFNSL